MLVATEESRHSVMQFELSPFLINVIVYSGFSEVDGTITFTLPLFTYLINAMYMHQMS